MEGSIVLREEKSKKHQEPLDFGWRVVRINVGCSQQESFTVHENLLCKDSSYFQRLFHHNGKTVENNYCVHCDDIYKFFDQIKYYIKCNLHLHSGCSTSRDENRRQCPKCGENRWIELDPHPVADCSDLNADAFRIYVQWLYRGSFSTSTHLSEYFSIEWLLIKAGVLGEIVDDYQFQRVILRKIVADSSTTHDWAEPFYIQYVYDHTPKNSELREFLVDLFVIKADDTWLENKTYPQEFVNELAQACLAKRKADEVDIKTALSPYFLAV